MRGEHCIAGASILSAVAVILLIFVNIGQINPGAVTSGLYFAEVNVKAFGAAWVAATNISAAGLYDTNNADLLGSGKGLRQYYRFGLYNSCGYQTDGSGACNSTIFGYPMEGLANVVADIPRDLKATSRDLSGNTGFSDDGSNRGMSRAGSLMIFIGSLAALAALITGALKFRISFLVASICAGTSAFLLMLGAALWTALITKDAAINSVKAAGKYDLGIEVYPGPALYLVWVSFVFMTLAVIPYVVSCCTYRKA